MFCIICMSYIFDGFKIANDNTEDAMAKQGKQAERIKETFQGFFPQTYDFLVEIALHNEKSYFEARRPEYEHWVKRPMATFEAALAPSVLNIDPFVRTGLRAISRIYRDTRFSKDKSPLRDHVWIAYRPPEKRLSESFCFYFEITPVSYAYGLGMYTGSPAFMTNFRERALANPAGLETILNDPALWPHFNLVGEDFVRPKVPDAKPPLDKVLNKKHFSLMHQSSDLTATYSAALIEEVSRAFTKLAPLYRFVTNLDA